MRVKKNIEETLTITDPSVVYNVDSERMLIEHFNECWGGKCKNACVIIGVRKLIRKSRIRANLRDLNVSHNVDVNFEIDCVVYLPNEIVVGDVVAVTDAHVMLSGDHWVGYIDTNDFLKSVSVGDKLPLAVAQSAYDISKPKATLQLKMYEVPSVSYAFSVSGNLDTPVGLIEQARELETQLGGFDKKIIAHMVKTFGGRQTVGKRKLLVDIEKNAIPENVMRSPTQYATATYNAGKKGEGEPVNINVAVETMLSQYVLEISNIVALCGAYTADDIKKFKHIWKIYA